MAYNHIRAWGKRLGSYEYYIKDQQKLAEADGAPLNAIYKDDDEWVTVDDITNEQTRDIVNRDAIKLEEKQNSLIGRKIVNIRPITDGERKSEGWDNSHSATSVIELDNGTILYPSSDDEGNSAGTLLGVDKDGNAFVLYRKETK